MNFIFIDKNLFVLIPGCKRYYINEDGLVYSERFKKILLPDVSSEYLRVRINYDGRLRAMSVHRLVAITFLKNNENKPCVNHKDFNRRNNSLTNLEWCTFRENSLHAFGIRPEPNKETIELLKKRRVKIKKYRDENRDELLAKRKVVRDKHIAELSDEYCIEMLKVKYSREHINAHPELIKEKRDSVIRKRRLKKFKHLL